MSNAEQIAKEFTQNLAEGDLSARREFLEANYQNSIWLQCPPYEGEPVDFWQYGPPVPGADGFIFLLGEVWKSPPLGGWIVIGDCQILEDESLTYQNIYQDFDQVKEAVELEAKGKYGA